MTNTWTRRLGLTAFVLTILARTAPPCGGAAPEEGPAAPILRPGQTVQGELPRGDPWDNEVDFELEVSHAGSYSVEARSLEFDTVVLATRLVPGGAAKPAGEDDDGGTVTNSRLVLEVEGPARYRLKIRQAEYPYCGTGFELSVREQERSVDVAEPEEDAAYWQAVEAVSPLCRLRSLLTRARGLWEAGRYTETKPLADEGRALAGQVLGDDLLAASSFYNLATLYQWIGDGDTARGLFERVLAIFEEQHGPEHPRVAQSLNNLALLLQDMGLFREALPLHERAVAIQERAGLEDMNTSAYVGTLGRTLFFLGYLDQAQRQSERALAIAERVLGPDHPWVADSLEELADSLILKGEWGQARDLVERALRIREASQGPEHSQVARPLVHLARLLTAIGSNDEAADLLRRVLRLTEAAHGADAYVTANVLQMFWQAVPFSEARPLLERAVAISEQKTGPDNPRTATSLYTLGAALVDEGLAQEAMPLLTRALRIQEEQLGPMHLNVENTLSVLARAHTVRGEFVQARELLARCQSITEEQLGPDNVRLARTLVRMAEIDVRTGQPASTFAYALRGEALASEHVRLTSRVLSERQALQYAGVRSMGLHLALSVAVRFPEDTGMTSAAWDALVGSRALVLDEMAARHRSILDTADPETTRLAADLTAARTRLAGLVVRGPGEMSPARYRPLLVEARRDKEKMEEALAARSEAFRAELARGRVGLTQVSASLPADSALVAFARYLDYPPLNEGGTREPSAAGNGGSPVASYLAFVLAEPGATPALVSLGSAAELDSLVARWLAETRRPPMGSPATDAERMYSDVARQLRRRVWDPIVPHLRGGARVLVVPDGSLSLLNLYALVLEDGRYLLEEGRPVHYLTAERDIVPQPDADRRGRGLLALGGPSFEETRLFAALRPEGTTPSATILSAPSPEPPSGGVQVAVLRPFRGARSSCGSFQEITFEDLPGSLQEVDEVTALWKVRAGSAVRLTASAASEAAVKAQAPGKQVLHIATHGFFLGEECASVLDAGRGVGGIATAGSREAAIVTGENPLLLAGLALAGANHRAAAAAEEEDGVLTAEEVAALDLSGVEWAVLSACETGIGTVRAGEGVFGLRRAFQIAGVRSLIMSLWSVEDESTRHWMRRLYEARLHGGLDTAAAVREASLRVLKARREEGTSTHPFYWAAFVAAGDWR